MKTEGIRKSAMLIGVVLAVVVSVPLFGALILLFRTAGIIVVAAGLIGMTLATVVSPTFRAYVRSLEWTAGGM